MVSLSKKQMKKPDCWHKKNFKYSGPFKQKLPLKQNTHIDKKILKCVPCYNKPLQLRRSQRFLSDSGKVRSLSSLLGVSHKMNSCPRVFQCPNVASFLLFLSNPCLQIHQEKHMGSICVQSHSSADLTHHRLRLQLTCPNKR